MAKTSAERQRDYRERHARRVARLEAVVADLGRQLATAEAGLESALAENERLAAMTCRHPAGAVDGGTCRACGAEVW
jgi:hypothetical protein